MKEDNNGLKEFIIVAIVITLIAVLFMEIADIWTDWFHNQ